MSQPTVKPNARPGKAGIAANQDSDAPEGSVVRRVDSEHGGFDPAQSNQPNLLQVIDRLPTEAADASEPKLSAGSMDAHAKDLAAQLAARRRDLDLRETRLNRQLLLLDQERQTARLGLSEKEQELETRLAVILKREKEILDQVRRCATAEEALRGECLAVRENLEAQKRALARDFDLLHREQERLRNQSASLEAANRRLHEERAAFAHDIDSARQNLHHERKQFEQNTQSVLAAIEEKQAALVAGAERLARERCESANADRAALDADRASMKRSEAEYLRLASRVEAELRDLAQRRASHDEDCRNERRRLLLERETMQLEHGRQQTELQRRQACLEDAQAALQKTQAELLEQQRSMLEERLAVEQATQSLSRSIGSKSAEAIQAARQKLAEHYRWMKESLQTQKNELIEIAKQLESREHAIAEDRDALQEWAESQQEELDAQLMQLEAQRQQIQRREAELTERELRWAAQKKGLESRLAIAQARAA